MTKIDKHGHCHGLTPPILRIAGLADEHARGRGSRRRFRTRPLKMDVVETSNTRIRLFVFPGAGDSAAAWVQFVNQARLHTTNRMTQAETS